MNAKIVAAYAAKHGLTPAAAEADIVRVAYEVSRRLSRRFAFGYHGPDDIEQQGVLEALEVLATEAYDVERPLVGFLYTHVKRRLLNLVRKQLLRSERPCSCCAPAAPPPEPCRKFAEWRKRNAAKAALMKPLDVACVCDDGGEVRLSVPSSVEDEAATAELFARIDAELDPDLRADYLRMRAGSAVPKGRRQRVREALLEILA